MAKAIYNYKGDALDYTNPSSTDSIEAGTIINLTTRIGVAAADIPAGKAGVVNLVGVYALPKTAELAIAVGDAVYFSTKTGVVTKTNSDVPCGFAAAAAAEADATVLVKIG
jgi:predicted RecA/RadA family phage recombinase|uniref:DUF2190 family protein n=1 Tax=Caudovirales sp. ct1Jx6 TaxID=2826765 RepID=A0A8S5ML14_9CAUD|nr:MAG TPA: protein of unknown function DUF2190 [Caudovirales sp. ct1Jx6]